jgi:prephenate dehydrogenase
MRRIAIIGLGLIGGSLGMALRRFAPEVTVVGIAPRADTLRRAEGLEAIHESHTDPRAAEGCDLAVVATPILAIEETLSALATASRRGLLLTDVASSKVRVLEWARAALPDPHRFLGGHPMAGKERAGLAAAEAGLFRGAIWVLTPAPRQDLHAFEPWLALIGRIGARPLLLDAATHDRRAAAISHLAFVLSAAYVDTLRLDSEWPELGTLASSGFRDMTRLASGSPQLYAQVSATNAGPLGEWIERLIAMLQEYQALITRNDPGLRRRFEEAKAAHDEWVRQRYASHSPARPSP